MTASEERAREAYEAYEKALPYGIEPGSLLAEIQEEAFLAGRASASTEALDLKAEVERLKAKIADYEKPGGWTWLREREARRVIGDPLKGVAFDIKGDGWGVP